MIYLVLVLYPAKDGDCVFYRRLIDKDGLEPAHKCLVCFKIFLILIRSGSSDSTQFATCKCGLEDIGSIHCAATSSCPDERMDLINKEDDLAIGTLDFFDHCLDALFKLAFKLGACDQGSDIKHIDLLGQ